MLGNFIGWGGFIFLLVSLFGGSEPEPTPPTLDINFEWRKVGFDLVLEADFVITNNTDETISDFTIVCKGFGNSGTAIDTNIRIIHEKLAPGKLLRLSEFNMGYLNSQVTRERCFHKPIIG